MKFSLSQKVQKSYILVLFLFVLFSFTQKASALSVSCYMSPDPVYNGQSSSYYYMTTGATSMEGGYFGTMPASNGFWTGVSAGTMTLSDPNVAQVGSVHSYAFDGGTLQQCAATVTINPTNCTGTPWGSVATGYSNTAYLSSSPAGACTSQTRTCTNGVMSGTYTNTSCSAGCTGTPWGSVSSGYSDTAYLTSTADTCTSQTRTCTSGTLSGSYTNTSCTVNSYSITFNSAGGSAVSTITQAYGTAVTPPSAPTRTGYTFTGWTPTIASTMPSGGQSLTATWSLNLPTVTSPTITSVTNATATMGASLTSGVNITARGTCWATTPSPTTNCLADSATSTGVFTQARTGLPAGTLIYFRGYATNATGTGYSSDSSTTTLNIPTVTSPTITSLTNATATMGATVTSNGGSVLTARGTCWGTTASPTSNCIAEGSTATGTFTYARTGLPAGTLIYYRGYATNAYGTGYSSDSSTTTLNAIPSISSPVSSSIGVSTTTLGATITSNGGSVIIERGTCYSTISGNATLALGACLAEGGTSVSSFAHTRTGFTASTTYYYQGYATNANGTVYSGEGMFTTQRVPVVTSPTASLVTNVSATLGANLTAVSSTTITARGTCFGTTASPVTNCSPEGATSTGIYTHSRTSLSPGTFYYYRGYVSYIDGAGSVGTAYSTDATFTTLTIPTVISPTYSSLSDTAVTVGATISSNGGSTVISRGTCWGIAATPVTNCFPEGGTSTALFTQSRTGLPVGTFIYARGYATNAYGTAYSADVTFTTYAPPTVNSPVVSLVNNIGATFGATITQDGGSAITARGTCWGTSSLPVTNCLTEGGVSVSSFTHTRTGMVPGTLYYYRGYATNAYGTSYSLDTSTTTLANLSEVTVTPGNTQARVDYITTTTLNAYNVIVLRSSTGVVTDVPVDNTSYSVGDTIGTSVVACIDTSIIPNKPDSCLVNGLTNTVPYYFAVFTKETSSGKYSGVIIPDGSPSTPDINATLVNLASYRIRNDDGGEATASYNVGENTPVTTDFLLGDKLRARFVLENQKTALTNKSYQLEYATGSCFTFYTVPKPSSVINEHWRMEPSAYLADNTITTHSSGVSVPGGKNFKPGRAQTFNNVTLPIVLKNNEYTEVEYSLRSTGNLTPYTPYCFRLTGMGESSDFVYSQVLRVLPFSSIYRKEAGGGGGGGAAAANTVIEASNSTGTSTTGGTVNSEIIPSTTIENVSIPAVQQSTTTPTRRRGGGGGVGLLNTKANLASASYVPMVLGAVSTSMCTDMKVRMTFGSDDVSTNGGVSELQYYLMKKGYLLNSQVTGNYLSATERAVKLYQKDHHLIVTGIAGKVTRESIREEGCIK